MSVQSIFSTIDLQKSCLELNMMNHFAIFPSMSADTILELVQKVKIKRKSDSEEFTHFRAQLVPGIGTANFSR